MKPRNFYFLIPFVVLLTYIFYYTNDTNSTSENINTKQEKNTYYERENLEDGDTFSIVAYDPSTGEIGSAGTSCVAQTIDFLGDLITNNSGAIIGGINTQAAYVAQNQTIARNRMLAGDTPQEIVAYMAANDFQGNSSTRQYGVVGFDDFGNLTTAGFTGNGTGSFADHITGVNYAIQGNILWDSDVLTDMETAFLNTNGTLADKLMAALKGAKRVGGDSRCDTRGNSGRSSFIKVLRPGDSSPFIDITLGPVVDGVEPIDELECAFINATSPAICLQTVSTFPYVMDFEDFVWDKDISSCGSLNNNASWIRTQFATPSQNTGPATANQGEKYMFVESSDVNNTSSFSKKAVIGSPCFQFPEFHSAQISFDYHMSGASMGTLNLTAQTSSGTEVIWTRTGNQGANWVNDETVDLSDYAGRTVKFRFDATTGTSFTSDMAIDDIKITTVRVPINFEFDAGVWTPNNPTLVDNPSTNIDNIEIVSGNPTFTNEVIANNVTISTGSTLNLGNATLSISGNLINNGSLNAGTGTLLLNGTSDQTISGNAIALNNFTVASNSTKTLQTPVSISGTMNLSNGVLNTNNQLSFLNTYDELSQTHTNGMLDEVTGGSIVGNVLVQRYFPAKRAYRLVASPVTTTTTIRENWQTDGNVVQGFGTHITGAGGTTNGFDATGTNNPSIFTLNTVGQNYEVLPNTNANTLSVGNAYLLMVRGDRTIDLTDNNATPSNTILESIGELHIGNFNSPNISTVENGSSLIANPYQASVDMALVLQNTTNLNQRYYHVYDPTINSRGAFVTVDTQENTNSLTFGTGISLSSADKFLQPSQAAFVNTVTNGAAALQFTEGFKDLSGNGTNVFFAELEQQSIGVALYNSEDELKDGTRIIFSEEDTNAVTQLDAIKNPNLDENISTKIEDQEFSIQRRAYAIAEDEIELSITNYREDNYKFKFQFEDLEPSTLVYLYDAYLNTQTPLNINGETIVNFNVNETNSSRASDRFKLVFQTNVLGANDINLNSSITISPNPASQFILISNPQSIGINSIVIYDLMGKQVIKRTNGLNKIDISKLESALYLVEVNSTLGSFQKRLIVK